MPVSSTSAPDGSAARPSRSRRLGRPVRRREPLTPLQARSLIVGGVLFVVLLYLVTLRGCQDGMVYVEGNRVEVTLREFRIEPQSISVKRGAIAFIVTNRGNVVHNLHIETIVPRSSNESAQKILEIKAMQPGQTNRGTQTLAPGKYRWRSTLANDDDLGMYGTIEVRQ